ncbi:exopolysaccharide biosynthesis protein, WecB/TagA/CpsF family [Rivularia sp. PCC 7116]|uniref:WecB/TagA/CpsF family glycosyltransferase n=1 Tax=Rivularia sp. PCC 7116 TaxID=373994 RepID=UPI00029F2EFB|nr:WecB/TagA/CpsF family glycosyltransferase [Rivularia sp. PCC 7116]AFY54586.1 exopolysaccharide biosynthesis protein, WecB/TagA/CpsF family [Rivularia sp. PCC 7116]
MASSFSFLRTPSGFHSDVSVSNTDNPTINDRQIDKPTALSIYLLERRIDCMSISSIVEAIDKACREDKKITVANYNIHSFNLSMQLPWYYEFLQSAEIANCDSVGILKAIGYMGLDLPLDYRTSYTLLMPKVLESCNRKNYSVFLLGGKPQCLTTAINNLQLQYPKVCFAGHHGYFDKQDVQANQSVIEQINQFEPNVLIVGMGMPIQEHWVQQYRDNLRVNAIMLGGAIIDRMAGIVPDCPNIISDAGFEWFYRFCREPKRLAARYLLGNPAFALHIALAMFHKMSLRVELTPKLENFDCRVGD